MERTQYVVILWAGDVDVRRREAEDSCVPASRTPLDLRAGDILETGRVETEDRHSGLSLHRDRQTLVAV